MFVRNIFLVMSHKEEDCDTVQENLSAKYTYQGAYKLACDLQLKEIETNGLSCNTAAAKVLADIVVGEKITWRRYLTFIQDFGRLHGFLTDWSTYYDVEEIELT